LKIMEPRPASLSACFENYGTKTRIIISMFWKLWNQDPHHYRHVLKIMKPRPASLSACFENYGTKTRIIIGAFWKLWNQDPHHYRHVLKIIKPRPVSKSACFRNYRSRPVSVRFKKSNPDGLEDFQSVFFCVILIIYLRSAKIFPNAIYNTTIFAHV
jgi:hypothetical protein